MQQTIPVNDAYIESHIGTTPETGPFTVDFPFFSYNDVSVTRMSDGSDVPILLVRGVDYTLVGTPTEDGSFSGGSITLIIALANTTIARWRNTTIERLSNFPLQGFFSRLALNAELNRITVVLQEHDRILDGGIGGGGGSGGGGNARVEVGPVPPAGVPVNTLWWNSDGAAGGGALYFLYDDGLGAVQWVPASPQPFNSVIQTVSYQTGAMGNSSTVIPFDDTIPQITEGTEYMTLAITPRSATSRLIIDINWMGTFSEAGVAGIAAALFQDTTANALAVAWGVSAGANVTATVPLRHVMISGTTNLTTFRVRMGSSVAGTITMNGSSSARMFGGVMASSIIIQEVL